MHSMTVIDETLLWAVAPRFGGAWARRQREIIGAIGPVLGETLAAHEVDTPLRVAHFLAQTGHESAGFRTTEEFASGTAYEGREDLGNTEPGDGVRFKGRGLIQLTGRANYARFGGLAGVDLLATPEAAADPRLSLRLACLYWREHRLNQPADRDDLQAVTRAVNGGFNGLDDRRHYLNRAKRALGLQPATEGQGKPVLRLGSSGAAVAGLQARLNMLGFALAVDGVFGRATALAVRRWQALNGLDDDGIVGSKSWAALNREKAPLYVGRSVHIAGGHAAAVSAPLSRGSAALPAG